MIDGWLARKLQAESKTGSVLDSIADLLFVACCAIQLLPTMSIPSWLWIWAGIIVIIKIVNQIIALTRIKQLCLPHTIANKLTGFLLFIAVPTINWSIIPIAIVALIATFAAIQEGYLLHSHSSSTTPRWTAPTQVNSSQPAERNQQVGIVDIIGLQAPEL